MFHHFLRKFSEGEEQAETNYSQSINNEELEQRLQSGEPIHLIDVREPAEYALGHIPGAVSIPLSRLELEMTKLDPEQEYIVICLSGSRSDRACRLLSEHGFKKLVNVVPGMSQWTGELVRG